MKLQETVQGTVIELFVKPKSKEFQVKIDKDTLIVWCRETPMKGRGNRELIKELSKLFRRKVKILYGFTSRQKKVLIRDLDVDEVTEVLRAHFNRGDT